jgi:uncharacterized membrane protein (DUF106 family)
MELTKEEIVKLQNELAEVKKANDEKELALKEKEDAITELTEQLASASKPAADKPLVKIGKVQYPLLIPEVRHEGKTLKLEHYLANPELAKEILDLDAGVFGEAVKGTAK